MKAWLIRVKGWVNEQAWPRMKLWLRKKQSWVLIGIGILAAGFVIAWQVEFRRHMATEQELTQTVQAKELVEAKLSAEEQHSRELSEALEMKIEEVEQVVRRLEEEAQTVEGLQGRLAQIERQMNQLQAELVLAMRDRGELSRRVRGQPSGGPVELEKITVSGLRPQTLEGKIIQVNSEWQFVVVDLGWDLLSVGDVLGVYRDHALIAEVQVERVQEQVAAARVLPEYESAEIAMDDRVAEL